MSDFRWVRIVAVTISVVTFAFFFIHDTFRLDNVFFVPDVLLCLVLIIGAVIPQRQAVPLLLASFGAAGGIFSVSVASYAVRGEFGAASLVGALISIAMVAVLTRFVAVKAKP
jgi:hypothetical protein